MSFKAYDSLKTEKNVLNIIKKHHKADIIGFVERGDGSIKIESLFSDKTITF